MADDDAQAARLFQDFAGKYCTAYTLYCAGLHDKYTVLIDVTLCIPTGR